MGLVIASSPNYATIADVRAFGVPVTVTNDQLDDAVTLAVETINDFTGTVFGSAVPMNVTINNVRKPLLPLPTPFAEITAVSANDTHLAASQYIVETWGLRMGPAARMGDTSAGVWPGFTLPASPPLTNVRVSRCATAARCYLTCSRPWPRFASTQCDWSSGVPAAEQIADALVVDLGNAGSRIADRAGICARFSRCMDRAASSRATRTASQFPSRVAGWQSRNRRLLM